MRGLLESHRFSIRSLAICCALVAVTSLAAESEGGVPSSVREDLRSLRMTVERDPVKDAEYSYRAGDLRFRGVASFVVHVPGIEKQPNERGCFSGRERVFVIRGTSDVVYTTEHDILNRRATIYAARFNQRMMALRKLRIGSPCEQTPTRLVREGDGPSSPASGNRGPHQPLPSTRARQ